MSKYARFDPNNKKANRKKNQYLDRKNDGNNKYRNTTIPGRFNKEAILDYYDNTSYDSIETYE